MKNTCYLIYYINLLIYYIQLNKKTGGTTFIEKINLHVLCASCVIKAPSGCYTSIVKNAKI